MVCWFGVKEFECVRSSPTRENMNGNMTGCGIIQIEYLKYGNSVYAKLKMNLNQTNISLPMVSNEEFVGWKSFFLA